MTITDKLVEQHIREYESRLNHLNELFEQAKQAADGLDDSHALKSELKQYQDQHAELVDKTQKIKQTSINHLREEMLKSAGPMGVWDILAQKLENLIERIEK